MANKTIKGLTIEIGGDTTKLGKALSDVDKRSRDLSTELKDIDKLLKFDPKNTELLAQKQKVLSEQLANTNDKLKILREAEEQVTEAFNRGEASEEQVRALQREIIACDGDLNKQKEALNATNEQLKGLEDGSIAAAEAEEELRKQAEEADKELAEQKKKTAEARKELGEYAEKGAKAAEKAAAAMGAAVAGAAAAVSKLVIEEAKNADELSDMSKKTGLSVEKLQEYRYVAEKAGTSLETMTGAQTKLVNTMNSARKGTGEQAEAFKKLGVSVTDSSGKLRKADDVFLEAIDRLGKMEDGTERDSIAMKIFGKSAQELNPLIAAGSKGIEEYTRRAHELGIVVSDEAVGSLSDVADGVKDVTFQFTALKSDIAADFAPVAKDVLDALSEIIKNTKEDLKDPAVKKALSEAGKSLGDLIKSGSKLGVKVLPVLANAIKYVAEHGKGLAITLGVIWGFFKSVSIWTNATKAISSVRSSFDALAKSAEKIKIAQDEVNLSLSESRASAAGAASAIGLIIAMLTTAAALEKKQRDEVTSTSREIKDAINEIAESQKKASDDFASSNAQMEIASSEAQKYIDRLKQLEAQNSLTIEEQAEYNRLIAGLNALFPELNLEIDNNTGKLENGTKAIEDQITQLKERAKFAAVEDLYTNALRNSTKLTIAKKQAETNLHKATEKYNNLLSDCEDAEYAFSHAMEVRKVSGIQTTDELEAAYKTLYAYKIEMEAAEEVMQQATDACESNANELSILESAYEETAKAVDVLTTTTEESTETWKGTTDAANEYQEALEEVGKEADALANDHFAKVHSAVTNMFEQVDTGTRTSMDELIKTLRANKKAMDDWDNNLAKIKARGASEEFVKYLEGMGIGYADQVAMIAESTDEEFKELTQTWKTNADDAYTSGQHYADMLMLGIINELQRNRRKLYDAGHEAARQVGKAFEDCWEIHSPSGLTKRLTMMLGRGSLDEWPTQARKMEDAASDAAQRVAAALDPIGEAPPYISTGTLDRIASSGYSAAQTSAAAPDMSGLNGKLDAILGAIEAGQVIMLDGDKVVGGTIERIDNELGERVYMARRRA